MDCLSGAFVIVMRACSEKVPEGDMKGMTALMKLVDQSRQKGVAQAQEVVSDLVRIPCPET